MKQPIVWSLMLSQIALYLSGINKPDSNCKFLNSTIKKKFNTEVSSKDSNYVFTIKNEKVVTHQLLIPANDVSDQFASLDVIL